MPKVKITTKERTPNQKVHQLNPRQLTFCHYYVNNPLTFSNATLSYAQAYGYDLMNADHTNLVETVETENGPKEQEIDGTSEYAKMYATCASNGTRALYNDNIQKEIKRLLVASLNDNDIDAELGKIIKQEYKFEAKLGGIKEYNKMRGRIVDKVDHTSDGKAITIQISEAVAKKNGLKQ